MTVAHRTVSLDPAAGLFALGCVGLYYVIPEWLLLHRSVAWRQLISVRNGLFALGLLALFLAFPMYQGHGMIRTVVKLTHQPPHITSGLLLFVPACLAVIRFSRLNLGTWLVLAHVAMMMKAFPWENYMVPLLAILWYLASAAPHTIGADFSCGLKSAAEDEPQSPTEIGT